VPSLATYPTGFPGQHTVPANQVLVGTGEVGASAGDTAYDISVVGPNRFLRRYAGNTAGAGTAVSVLTVYHEEGRSGHPKLQLSLRNQGALPVTFTIVANSYLKLPPQKVTVAAHHKESWEIDAVGLSNGWYDLSITVDRDSNWSQRLTGHLETGKASISG
jgi:phospholipase C